jgi:segregation and condensation protein B
MTDQPIDNQDPALSDAAPIDLLPLVEAALFVSSEPVKPQEIARAFGVDAWAAEEALEDLVNSYGRREHTGLQVIRVAGGYQITTRPDLSEDIARFLASPNKKARLSKPALETLAIVAYQQPVTVADLEAVRRVSVDGVLKTLMERGLVQEVGRKQVPGRPILYGTTDDFLHYFGLHALDDLPPLEDVEVAEEVEHARHEAMHAVGLEE